MKTLIGQAYHLHLDPKNWSNMELFPPLGSLYAAAVLREAGHEVHFSDSMIAESTDVWEAALEAEKPQLAVLYEDNFNYLTKMCLLNMRDAAQVMIEAAKKTGAVVIVAGSDASDVPEIYLGFGADVVINGEGEITLEQLVATLEQDGLQNIQDIEGITFYGADGAVIKTPKRRSLRDIDSLPMPAWDLIDLSRYRVKWKAHHGRFELNIATSRGCPFHCNWCAKPIWGRAYNARSPEKIADEFAMLAKQGNPDRIWVMDDIFAMKPGWARSFANALNDRDLRLPFKCLSRADLLLRKGEVEALADAGCQELWIGAESGSQKILDAMEKGTSLQQIDDATTLLKQHGIRVGFFLQYGYPGETWADIKQTFGLLRRNLPDVIGISVSYPLPGTPFHDRVLDQLGSKKNWQHADDLDLMYRGPFKTSFYRVLHRFTHRLARYQRGTATPIQRDNAGKINQRATLREAAGTLRALVYMVPLWAQLHVLRLTSKPGVTPIDPKLSRAAAGLGAVDLGEGN